MSVRADFKEKVAKRFVDELPDGVKYVLPDFPTDAMKGEDEWVHLIIKHNTSDQKTHSAKGNRRFNRMGQIIIRIFTKPGQGPNRADEIAEAVTNMFEGRALEGFAITFTNTSPREAGLDNDNRYNVVISETEFHYREIK